MLFANWLIATTIILYLDHRKLVQKQKASSGTTMVSIFYELDLVRKKFFRSVTLFVMTIMKNIKKGVKVVAK